MAFYPGVKEDNVRVGDTEVRILDSGPKTSGRTIVLCHGTGGTAEGNFWALFPMLAMRHRVIAFDFVDAAPAVGHDASAAHYVDQVRAVIRATSPDGPVDLIGYSFGAVIAALVAARSPDLVNTLVLIAGWLKTDPQQRLRNQVWTSLYESDHAALAEYTVFTQFSPPFINSRLPHELAAELQKVRKGPDRAVKMKFNRDVDVAEEVATIAVPTLVVGCTQDQVAPIRHSHLLFGAIRNARLAQVEAGHGVLTERPSEVFTMIDDFISDPQAIAPGAILQNDHA